MKKGGLPFPENMMHRADDDEHAFPAECLKRGCCEIDYEAMTVTWKGDE